MFHIAQDDDLVPLINYDKYTLKAEGTGKMDNPGTHSTLDIHELIDRYEIVISNT
jgi:hypothetical protein